MDLTKEYQRNFKGAGYDEEKKIAESKIYLHWRDDNIGFDRTLGTLSGMAGIPVGIL